MTQARFLMSRSKHWKAMSAMAFVLALLWAQAFGMAHRVYHSHSSNPPAAQVVLPAVATAGVAGHTGLLAHFDESAGTLTPDCRLLDQLGHNELLLTASIVWVQHEAPHFCGCFQGLHQALTAPDFFEARGPPLTV